MILLNLYGSVISLHNHSNPIFLNIFGAESGFKNINQISKEENNKIIEQNK